jgi:hypothetical protein
MTETQKKRSTLFLLIDLLREITVFINLELKLAIAEVRRNIGSAKRGVIQVAIVLPLWLASLIVDALYVTSGFGFS